MATLEKTWGFLFKVLMVCCCGILVQIIELTLVSKLLLELVTLISHYQLHCDGRRPALVQKSSNW